MDAREMGSGFSNGEWLCCSLFALIAHSSPENLLTCHLIYHLWIRAWIRRKRAGSPRVQESVKFPRATDEA